MTLLPNLPDIGEYAPKIFPSLIMLFDGLKRAYEAAKDDEDSDDDSDEVILPFSGRLRSTLGCLPFEVGGTWDPLLWARPPCEV